MSEIFLSLKPPYGHILRLFRDNYTPQTFSLLLSDHHYEFSTHQKGDAPS